jgi:dTDP-glucose 4,6-dehydratase
MKAQTRTVLVTGGAGFIGSHLIMHLLQTNDWHVIHLDALTYAGNLEGWGEFFPHPRHHLVHGCVTDAVLVGRLLREHQPQALMHLAAESHVDRSIDGPAVFVRTNVVGTANLLEQALRYWQQLPADAKNRFRFLHLSTDEVYGSLHADEPPFTEHTRYAPRSPYSASKAAADHLVAAWHHTYDFPSMIANSSNNYGPRQFPEKLIPLAILKMLRGETIPLYGDGLQIRDWLHVSDHCRALVDILERGVVGDRYLIGSGRETRNRDLLQLLCGLMDQRHPRADGLPHETSIRQVDDRPGHDQRYAIDASHLQRQLGWQPQVTLEQGLGETVDWYLANQPWWENILQKRYAMERLGRTH